MHSAPRERIYRWRFLPGDLPKLFVHFSLIRSGLSADSGDLDLVPQDKGIDAYVDSESLDVLRRRFKPLEESSSPNAILRVPSLSWPLEHSDMVPPAVIAADLLVHEDPRVVRAAKELLARLAA